MNKLRWNITHLAVTLCMVVANSFAAAQQADEFDHHVAPVIAQHCLGCHSGDDPKGGLDLSSRMSAMAGGESGRAIIPGQLNGSLLWQYVDSGEMPPKKPLPAEARAILKTWIVSGAHWGTERIDPFRYTTGSRAGIDWWSLQPLTHLQPPEADDSAWIRNPIDSFIMRRLSDAGLAPSAEADKQTLIRRLSFDLTGLPPTAAEVKEFLSDKSEKAYEGLVDRLLASPHYGERWARHWLDIVRFGESNGYEYDQPRDNAWHYRNWIIDALNQDLPYDEFVRMQLAGDVLNPDDFDSAAATGFLVAGPHNTTLPANDKMRMSMAQDELEDLVGIVGQTFLGLTVNCARCHDHKFDPILQTEYYQLAASLAGVTHGERDVNVPLSEAQQSRLTEIADRLDVIRSALAAIEDPTRELIVKLRHEGKTDLPQPPAAFATWEFDDLQDSRGALHGTLHGGARIEDGCLVLDGKEAWFSSVALTGDVTEKTLEAWVKLDNIDQRGGGVISLQSTDGGTFDAIVFGEREPRKWMAGSNGFVRTMPFGGTEESDAAGQFVHVAIVYQDDGTIFGFRDGRPYGMPYRPRELQPYQAGKSQFIFGLRHSPVGGNRMLSGRIQRAQFYDRALTTEEISASASVADMNYVSAAQLLVHLSDEQRSRYDQLTAERDLLETERDQLKASQIRRLYTCVSSNPGVTHVLLRGDVGSPGDVVVPAGLKAIVGSDPDFQLSTEAADADRRQRLADWVTHANNPLFSRVMVNRLWQYHFGQGLVLTSSDFGFNGGRPSHPELLEWLAGQFRQSGFCLKDMHRLIVTSATYRQSADMNDAAAQLDADNRLLWRKSPQRLTAEEIRDASLVLSQRLDSAVGGDGYRDVRHFQFKGSNFYESIDEAEGQLRRTIYRFTPRGGRNPFLDTFDCPDPSVTTPRRATTTTPLQALALMNNRLVFQMADDFAARVQREAGESVEASVPLVYQIAYSRDASYEEVQAVRPFVETHGLAAFCRIVLNSNEFLYVR